MKKQQTEAVSHLNDEWSARFKGCDGNSDMQRLLHEGSCTLQDVCTSLVAEHHIHISCILQKGLVLSLEKSCKVQ